jgi:Trypsin
LHKTPIKLCIYSTGQYSFSGCGQNFKTPGKALAIGAEAVNIREVPWMAALYTLKKQTEHKTNQWLGFKCGGSLISTRFVLTGKS